MKKFLRHGKEQYTDTLGEFLTTDPVFIDGEVFNDVTVPTEFQADTTTLSETRNAATVSLSETRNTTSTSLNETRN